MSTSTPTTTSKSSRVHRPSAVLQFVTVHKVRDGQIVLWKDYRDYTGLANHAPPDWMEQLAKADISCLFDATELI